jgi:hypothetical protein
VGKCDSLGFRRLSHDGGMPGPMGAGTRRAILSNLSFRTQGPGLIPAFGARGASRGGRGLLLVDSLADEWGVIRLVNGKQVWFRISTDDWSYRSGCMCHSDSIDRVRLESGRYALALPGPWDA